jgi:membrane protease YdiL (CAAX protease family)
MGTVGVVLLQLPTVALLFGLEKLALAHGASRTTGSPPFLFLEMALPCLTIVLFLAAIQGFSFPAMRERYGLRWPALSAATFAIAVVGMLALAVETVALSDVLKRYHWLPTFPSPSFWHFFDDSIEHAGIATRILLVLSLGIFPGVSEELLYRGHVQRALLERWSPLAAIVVTSTLFAAGHVDPGRFLTTFTFGFWVGWIAWRCGSILPGMALHAINNSLFALIGALVGLLVSHAPGPHPPAPVTSLLAVAMLGLAVTALCAHLLARRLPMAPARETSA